MTKKLIILAAVLMNFACSSTPVVNGNAVEEDKVIARIDGLSSRPDWLRESEPFKVENQKVLSLGSTTIGGDEREEAAYRIAENNAKASISSAIEQRLEFVFQNAEEGTSMDATQARFIGSEASKMVTSSLMLSKRYWEKVVTTDSNVRVSVHDGHPFRFDGGRGFRFMAATHFGMNPATYFGS